MENTAAHNAPAAADAGPALAREIATFQENLESKTSFVLAHPGGVFDFRPMAREIRDYLASDKARQENFRDGIDAIRHNWLTNYYKDTKFEQADLPALHVFHHQFEEEFRENLSFRPTAMRRAPASSLKSFSDQIVDRMATLFNIAEASREDLYSFASGTGSMSAAQREDKLREDMTQLCRRFGLASFNIVGETAMTLRERERFVARTQSLLGRACDRLGIEEVSYGDEGKLQLYCGRDLGANGYMHAVMPSENGHKLPKIGLSQGAQLHTAIHEFGHYVDFKCARLATGDDLSLLGQERFFSHLPETVQDRLPAAKEALHDVMGVHQVAHGKTAEEAIKQFQQHMVNQLMGKVGFLSASMEQMTSLNDLLTRHDNLFTRTVVDWCTKGNDEDRIFNAGISDDSRLYAVTALSCGTIKDASGNDIHVDLTGKIAKVLGMERADCEKKMISALAASTEEIRKVAGYVNSMTRYVDRPDEMLRAGGETLMAYPNRETEVLARTIGRPSNLKELLANIDNAKWFSKGLSERKRVKLNNATGALMKAVGLRVKTDGPKLGLPYEQVVGATLKGLVKLGEGTIKLAEAAIEGFDKATYPLDMAYDALAPAFINGSRKIGSTLMQTLSGKTATERAAAQRAKAP